MRYLSVCSGIEAVTVATERLDWSPVAFAEVDPFPSAVLAHRFPHVPNLGDITQHENWKLERGAIDLLAGGPPCQSFSVAGNRGGLGDARGNLILTFLEIAARLQPRWIIFENVPGILSSAGGDDFREFLRTLAQLGYGYAYRVLDAQFFGVPQRRRRVYLVASFGDWRRSAEVLFEPESLRGNTTQIRPQRKNAPASTRGSVEIVGTLCADSHPGSYAGQDAYTGRLIAAPQPFVKSKRAQSVDDDETWQANRPAPTLSVFDSGDTRTTVAIVTPPPLAVRRLTPRECERLQGFPDDWTAVPYRGKPAADGPRYKAIGNSMAVPVMRWIAERIAAIDNPTPPENR